VKQTWRLSSLFQPHEKNLQELFTVEEQAHSSRLIQLDAQIVFLFHDSPFIQTQIPKIVVVSAAAHRPQQVHSPPVIHHQWRSAIQAIELAPHVQPAAPIGRRLQAKVPHKIGRADQSTGEQRTEPQTR
jgi:hypothetical protein